MTTDRNQTQDKKQSARKRGEGNDPARVIPIHDAASDEAKIDPMITAEILTSDVIDGLRGYAEIAAARLSSAVPGRESIADIDSLMVADGDKELSEDARLALAEFNITIARYGLTPVNSVEGILKLRKVLVDTFRDNAVVPIEVKLEAQKLERELQVLNLTRDNYLLRKERDVETQATLAIAALEEARRALDRQRIEDEKRTVAATAALELATVALNAQRIESELKLDDATTKVMKTKVENKKKQGIAQNEDRVLDKVLDNDRLEKTIDARRKTVSLIWTKVVRPIARPIFIALLWVTIIGIVGSFFVEMAGMGMYPVLVPFNALRHFLFDPVVTWIVSLMPKSS